MIGRLRAFFRAPAAQAAGAFGVEGATQLYTRMQALNADPYLQVAEPRLISVFDDLKYDRADIDMLSPVMRRHAIAKLAPLGFAQVSGSSLRHAETGVSVLIPKFHAQGASPFDITRYTPKSEHDFYLLTPTQSACRMIDSFGVDEAVERIKALIVKHPINLYRLMDYLESKPPHDQFRKAIGHLKFVQREAIESDPLRRRRALG